VNNYGESADFHGMAKRWSVVAFDSL
jgi:hypothetical protein